MSRKGWLLFGSLCVIWGIPYLLIRVAVRELPPPSLVFLRTTPAALLLLPIAWRRGELRGILRHWVWIVAFAACEMIVPWLLLADAERTLTSSMSGLLIASVPLICAVLYPLLGATGERLDRRRLAGLVVGFAGVACLVGIDTAGTTVLAIAEIFVAAVGYALGPLVISRRLHGVADLGVASLAIAVTGLLYAPWGIASLPSHLSTEVLLSVAGLAFICTATAFLVFFALIREVGPSRSTVITYINPLVAVLLGVVLLSEPFTVGIAVGLPLILLGSVLATGRSPGRDAEQLPGQADTAGDSMSLPS